MNPTDKLTRKMLRGIWHALLTPWTDQFELDEKRYIAEVRSYESTGIHGMYTGGTTGEFYAQDDDTFQRITAITCEHAHDIGLPVQIGCTATATRIVCKRIAHARKHNANAIQLGLPYWLELNDNELNDFFAAICNAAGDTPIVYYQTMRNKRRIKNEHLQSLAAKHPTFIGMKDTDGELAQLESLCKGSPGLAVFGGEPDLVTRMKLGGTGAYASITGLNAPLIVRMYELAAAGNFQEAEKIQTSLKHMLDDALIPLIHEGYLDSALDRLMRTSGGGDVGLQCQPPYQPCTQTHVEQLTAWCEEHEPMLLKTE